jgi:hypothetical protein
MRLTQDEVRQVLRAPVSGAQLQSCRRHEERLRLHSEPQLDRASLFAAPAMTQLLALPAAVLPKDKYETFKQFIPAPLPTADLVETAFAGWARVFEAQDGLVHCELSTPELETEFEAYRASINEPEFWPGAAFSAACHAYHSVLVVDMPRQQTGRRPAPYLYLIELENIVDLLIRPDATLEFIAFRLNNRTEPSTDPANPVVYEVLAFYDDAFYRIYERLSGQEQWVLVVENAHQLGQCPARLLWSQSLGRNPTQLARRGPLTAQLAALDRYVYWDASVEYFQSYGMYPILWSFAQQCEYQTVDGQACQSGIVQVLVGYTKLDGQEVPRYQNQDCPACAKKKAMGPGSHIEVPAPTKETGDTRDPVGLVHADVDSVKLAREAQAERRHNILLAALGGGVDPGSVQARNEQDVQSSFETRQDVLVRLRGNFEKARTWALTLMGRAMYAAAFRRAVVNMGERYYLKSPEQLLDEEVKAKEAGRPVYELAQAREFRYDTLYRTNPPLRDRMRILSDLEPFAEQSVQEVSELMTANAGIFDPKLLALKVDFARYLARFESEQANVGVFAALQPYHVKLQLISSQLLSYVVLPPNPAPAAPAA